MVRIKIKEYNTRISQKTPTKTYTCILSFEASPHPWPPSYALETLAVLEETVRSGGPGKCNT